jgi:hypothetical protein
MAEEMKLLDEEEENAKNEAYGNSLTFKGVGSEPDIWSQDVFLEVARPNLKVG